MYTIGRHIVLPLSVCLFVSLSVWMCHTFLNATPTFLDGFRWNLAQSKMMMPSYAWSEDFPVRWCLQKLCPLTLTLFHSLFLSTQLLLHFSMDLDDTRHTSRKWCIDVHDVRISQLIDICKSYGPWHYTFSHLFLMNANPPAFFDGFQWILAHSKMMMPRCALSEDFPVRRI
jgi:hypothetical protein